MTPIVLVACGSQKLDHAAPAQDLYTGDLFKKSRAWAERFGSAWFILSAKHGLVAPGQVLDPYNVTLNTMDPAALSAWDRVVRAQFDEQFGGRSNMDVVVLAGLRYRRWCEGRPGFTAPMAGLGIGSQKGWLRRALIPQPIGSPKR